MTAVVNVNEPPAGPKYSMAGAPWRKETAAVQASPGPGAAKLVTVGGVIPQNFIYLNKLFKGRSGWVRTFGDPGKITGYLLHSRWGRLSTASNTLKSWADGVQPQISCPSFGRLGTTSNTLSKFWVSTLSNIRV